MRLWEQGLQFLLVAAHFSLAQTLRELGRCLYLVVEKKTLRRGTVLATTDKSIDSDSKGRHTIDGRNDALSTKKLIQERRI